MKRILSAAAVLIAAVSPSAVAASSPNARLRAFSCRPAITPMARGVSVTAVMHPTKGTKRMLLRFELLSRTKPHARWKSLGGGDLRRWISPTDPTLGRLPRDVWIVNKSVNDLAAPALYRLRVSFRWIGARQRILGTSVQSTPTCWQPELRPDLAVRSIDVRPDIGHPTLNRYVATVVNNGRTAARGFRVEFMPGGGLGPKFHPIKLLAAHATTQTTFLGRACNTTAASTVTADPDGLVDDFNRANNTLMAACPGF